MHGSCYINGKLSEGTSLIIWEEQREIYFYNSKGKKMQENKKMQYVFDSLSLSSL